MKTSRTLLQHLLAWAGMVATVVAAACTSADPTNDPKSPNFGPLPRITTEPVSNGECTGRAAAPTLSLQGPGDRAFRLAHIPGCGWRLLAESANVGKGTSGLRGVAEAPVEASAAHSTDPMAVFIDGPTGYTFAWSRDAGWKFVGHLVDEDR